MQIHISRDGQTYGPYTPAQMNEMLQNGEITSSDAVWIQSTEWEKVSALAGFLGPRPEVSSGTGVSITRSGTSDRLTKLNTSGGTSGLSSSQTINHRVRRETDESDGTENLMRGMFGL